MSITNYWFQLIWLLTVGMVLAISLPKKQEIVMGRIEERWQIAPAVLLVVPYILAATLRSDNFGDTYAYRSVFREAPSKIAALPLYLEGIKKDKGFSVLIVIIKALIGNSPILFFMFIATVQMLCMAFIYRKYSENYWMSIFVFVAGTDYMSWCHNGIRQFLAIAIIMAGFPLTHTFTSDKWDDYKALYARFQEEFGRSEIYDFRDQLDKVLLFFIYNAIGDIFCSSVLTIGEKKRMVNKILYEDSVRNMFKQLKIGKLCVPKKQKLLTFCYSHPVLLPLISFYFEKRYRV